MNLEAVFALANPAMGAALFPGQRQEPATTKSGTGLAAHNEQFF
jgi:hypothetical protein